MLSRENYRWTIVADPTRPSDLLHRFIVRTFGTQPTMAHTVRPDQCRAWLSRASEAGGSPLHAVRRYSLQSSNRLAFCFWKSTDGGMS